MGCWRVYSGLVEQEAQEAERDYGVALERGKELRKKIFADRVLAKVVSYIDPFEETRRFMFIVEGDSPEVDGWLSFSTKDEAVNEFEKVGRRYVHQGSSAIPA